MPKLIPLAFFRLFGNFFLRWCEGGLSARRLVFLASEGAADGFQHPILTRLASLHQQSVGFIDKITKYLDESSTTACDVRLHGQDYRVPGRVHHLLDVAENYDLGHPWLLARDPSELWRRPGQAFYNYWCAVRSKPCNRDLMESHPVVAGLGFEALQYVIPLTFHADAGPFSKTTACYVVSFSSLLGLGEAKLCKYMCAAHVKRNGGDQDFHWWGHLIDDFHALGSGDLHGEDVVRDSDATVWRFALLFAKSDEDVRANDFGLAHFPAIDEVSSECLAFTDMRETATWRLGELHGEGRLLNGVVVALDELCNLLHAAFLLPEPSDVACVRDLCPDFGQAYQRMRELSRRSGVYVLI